MKELESAREFIARFAAMCILFDLIILIIWSWLFLIHYLAGDL